MDPGIARDLLVAINRAGERGYVDLKTDVGTLALLGLLRPVVRAAEAAARKEEQKRLHELLQWAQASIDPETFPACSSAIHNELAQCDHLGECGHARKAEP